jgi:ABC-2 type transport system permease protein
VNLVRAEFGRLFARRFVQLMLVLLVAAFGITVATTLVGSHRPSSQELVQARQRVDQERIKNEEWYNGCLAEKQLGTDSDLEIYPEDCEGARPIETQANSGLQGVFIFERQIRPLVQFLIGFLVLFAFLVGASYIGADLTSGGMTNLLLWRPQRMTVLGTKLGTLLGAVLAVSVVAAVVYLGAFWLVAVVNGVTGRLGGEFWGWLSLTTGRGLVLILLGAALGFAIATLGRHTAAALGVIAAYGVFWEGGARVVMEIISTSRSSQWMLSAHVAAFMSGKLELWDSPACPDLYNGKPCDATYTLSGVTGLIVLLAVVGGTVAVAFAQFRRRDLV